MQFVGSGSVCQVRYPLALVTKGLCSGGLKPGFFCDANPAVGRVKVAHAVAANVDAASSDRFRFFFCARLYKP
jgi:hypothetical protein